MMLYMILEFDNLDKMNNNNMKEFVQIKREENSGISVMWQFIAMRNNEHQIELAEKMAKQIGIDFFVKTFAESVPDLVPSRPEYRRELNIKPCLDIYRNMFCYWNGDVVPCCFDQQGKEVMGNLVENTIEEIWNGSKMSNLRDGFRYNNLNKIRKSFIKSQEINI